MKKILFFLVLFLILLVASVYFYSGKTESELKKLKLAEVTHSVFYAPQYLADKLGFFEDEGIDLEIILTPGADKVTAAVLSGDADIGFCGSEATIYVYNNGEKDYLINFAALTKKDGSFLVSRVKYDNFTVKDLIGKQIIAGRKGGMPAMTLEWAINQTGISSNEVNIDTSIEFSAQAGTFISGIGEFVTLFEPAATNIEKNGYGFIVASVGELGGEVPYTAYNARKSFIEENEDTISGFTKAIDKALEYIHNHTAEEIADIINSYFPDTTLNDLTTVTKRYMEIDAWNQTSYINQESFDHIQEIIENAGELTNKAPYDKLVLNKYSKK